MSTLAPSRPASPSTSQIDPRGPRFGAWVTSAVLVIALLVSGSDLAAGLVLAAQAVVFALGSQGRSPYVQVWKRWFRRGAPTEFEDAAPPRFAQLVGLTFAVVGALGFLTGASVVGLVATAFALVAALLNAAVGLCLGCELYLLFKRTTTRGVPA